MAGATLFEKVWRAHEVARLPDGRSQLFVGLHLIHEVTSPQAFAMLRELGLGVAFPDRTFATLDHIVPTDGTARPFADPLAEEMAAALEANVRAHGIRYFGPGSGRQGIVHVVGPELGLSQPGMTICCGDSHTSTHGAFGALAFGIGTSQVRDVLATGTLALSPLRVRRVEVEGALGPGVEAKDLILHLIARLGVRAGVGWAHELTGSTVAALSMEERMTLCNMAVEGGARVGYVNPDETTFAYLRGRPFAPGEADWDEAVRGWRSLASDPDAAYDDRVRLRAEEVAPTVTWGLHPGQSVPVDRPLPREEDLPETERAALREACAYMDLRPGRPIRGLPVDVVFVGSCTNGRLSDLRAAAAVLRGRRVHPRVRALVVPGSEQVAGRAEAEGLVEIFREAGFQWRSPGCSLCLAMNPDRLEGRQLCASTSNRNFKGRQGSPSGRTVLMSPVMAAAAAVTGEVADAREVFGLGGETRETLP